MGIEIRPAEIDDIPAIADVLSQAARHKSEKGDYLWGDQPYTTDEVGQMLESGGLYAVTADGTVTGTVRITDSDERVWGDDGTSSEALYVHGLATSDTVRGQNVGGKVLEWVAEKAKQEGKKAVRLDCSYTNRGLCNYYVQRGFAEIKRRDIPRKSTARDLRDPVYQAALLQRTVI